MSRHFVNNLRVLNTGGTPGVPAPVRSWVNGPPELGHARTLLFTGTVVSAGKMQKSISVEVNQFVRHPIIRKFVRSTSKMMAHDEFGECQHGDVVEIRACRPLSKRKRFTLHRILRPKPAIEWQSQHQALDPLTHKTAAQQAQPAAELPSTPSDSAPLSHAYRARLQKALVARK